MEQKKTETTIGDRASTGAVNGAIGALAMGGTFGIINAVSKLVSKSGKFALSPMQWKLTGAATAIAAAYGFITANKAEENKREAYIEKATEDANNPANNYSPKQREEIISKAFDDVINDKMPQNAESSKFRDKVTASRAANPSQEIGA